MDINVTTRQLQYTSPVSPWPAKHLQRDGNQRQNVTATIHITCLAMASRTSAERQKSTSDSYSYNTHHLSHYGQPNICKETEINVKTWQLQYTSPVSLRPAEHLQRDRNQRQNVIAKEHITCLAMACHASAETWTSTLQQDSYKSCFVSERSFYSTNSDLIERSHLSLGRAN